MMISFGYYLDTILLGKTSAIKRTDDYHRALIIFAMLYLDHSIFLLKTYYLKISNDH